MTVDQAATLPNESLEERVSAIGRRLASGVGQVIEALPGCPTGPQALAAELGLDKVLASRMLKAVRAGDPMAVVHHAPGPAPMRRLVRAAAKRGVPSPTIETATAAIDAFDLLIRRDVGDRSGLDAIISAWLPEARRDFELRRKQAAYRAMSQLKGASAATCLSTVVLNPSEDGRNLDVVWIFGFLRLQRLRPGVAVTCASRRMAAGVDEPRHPQTLRGDASADMSAYRLDDFCVSPPAPIERQERGETVHYVLAGDGFGPGSETDLLVAEVNLAEMPRTPADPDRRGYVFAEVSTPSQRLLFDCFVHEDVYADRHPQLILHDTAYEGVADLNDRSRDADRIDLAETINHLGRGTAAARDTGAPRHVDMLRHVFTGMGWDETAFRGYRCVVDYPIHGVQVSMAF